MQKYEIRLDTMNDAVKLNAICQSLPGKINLIDGSGQCISAKSLLGALCSMEFTKIYIESESDIYSHIVDFII